jgi:flagellar secretion chaperone FliS
MYQIGCNTYRQSAGNMLEDKNVILLKLYEGAIKFLSIARRGIEANSPKIRGENISKAMAIITELDCALDMEKGGAIAVQLRSLYQFALDRLLSATMKNDMEALGQAKDVLTTLKEGFEGAVRATSAVPPRMETAPRSARFAA